jgi:hypothetical protein
LPAGRHLELLRSSQLLKKLLAGLSRLLGPIVEPVLAQKRSDLRRDYVAKPRVRIIDSTGRRQVGMTDTVLRPKPVITRNLLIEHFDPVTQLEDEGAVEAAIDRQTLLPTIIETRLEIDEGKAPT